MRRFASALMALAFLLMPSVRLLASPTPPPQPLAGSHILEELFAEELARYRAIPADQLPQGSPHETIPVGGWNDFWSIDMTASQPFQVHAQLRHIGQHCYIYVEEGREISDETVAKLASQFDTKIFPTDHEYFGSEATPGIDWDPRITLLLMDIRDGWEPGKGYVAGYFFPLDEVSTRIFPQSNERQIFYLDAFPGDPSRDDYLGILAHEFQHMIHANNDRKETRWLNEALAQIAFFVNDFGHAPQIFSFVRSTDTALTEFDNGLDDYGSVYLWTYYVLTKYAGAGAEAQKAFTKALVASQEKGMASFDEVLAGVGGPTSAAIFQDWVIANVADAPSLESGRFGYDETLRFSVQPSATHSFRGKLGKTKGEVFPWGADYLTFVGEELYKPLNPTMVDRPLLLAREGVQEISWTINGGQVAPQNLWPEGSREEGGRVFSPVLDHEGGRGVQIGPFARKGVKVESVEFANGNAEVAFSVFNLDQLVTSFAGGTEGNGFDFQFSGKAADLTVTAVVKGGQGTEVVPLQGGRYQRPDLAGVDSISFVVAGNPKDKTKKGIAYSYKASGPRAASDLQQAARLRQIEDQALELAAADQEAGRFLAGVSQLRRQVEERLAGTMLASRGLGALDLAARVAEADGATREHTMQAARAALRIARFRAMDRTVESGEVLGASLEVGVKGDDGDDSHDNVGYLLFKAGEVVHSLDHLKIDPQMLEGQILALWRLLEIARGFPHLPIPDGLNVVDYDMTPVRGLMQGWANQFGVDYDAGADPLPVGQGSEQDVKETLRRIQLAGEIVEIVYNNSLLMADDVSISVYDFVRMVFNAISTSGDIAKVFERIPVVGKAVKYLRQVIHRKLVRVVELSLIMLSSKLKPPYSTYGPIVISLVSWVYSRFMGLPEDPSNPGNQNGLKEMAVKIMGRYALTAMPRFGFVRKGQPMADLIPAYGAELTHEGTLEEATKRVMDDGTSATEGSIREQLFVDLADRHHTFTRNRKIFDITRRLVSIGQYASALDPTNISKILTVVVAGANTGLLAHSAYRTGSLFVKSQKQYGEPGVRLAFDPGLAGEAAEDDGQIHTRANAAFLDAALARTEAAYAGFEEALRAARAAAGFRMEALAAGRETQDVDERFVAAAEALEAADRDLEDSLSSVMAMGFTAEGATELEEGGLIGAATTEVLARGGAVSEVLSRGLGVGSTQIDAGADAARKQAVSGLVSSLRSAFANLRSEDMGARVLVSESSAETRQDGSIELTATVVNPSDVAIEGIQVGLLSGQLFSIQGDATPTIAKLAPGQQAEVRWVLVPGEEFGFLPLVSIVPEAEGVQGVGKLQRL